jgi:hypothetical protein
MKQFSPREVADFLLAAETVSFLGRLQLQGSRRC